jgi:hypothetical protein
MQYFVKAKAINNTTPAEPFFKLPVKLLIALLKAFLKPVIPNHLSLHPVKKRLTRL